LHAVGYTKIELPPQWVPRKALQALQSQVMTE
jgi:hypothetical protein